MEDVNVDNELFRIAEMISVENLISNGSRTELSDYLRQRQEQVAKLKLATLMTQDEIKLFAPLLQVQMEGTRDNGKSQEANS